MTPLTALPASGARMRRRAAVAALVLGATATLLPSLASAATVDEDVRALQHDWETIRYQSPPPEREKRFAALAAKAHEISAAHPGRSEPLVWEGIIVSSWAGEKGGLGALGLVKQAKALYEAAIQIDGTVLEGSAYNSLGVLYYKVPGWPLGFGDKGKADALLQKALTINPDGIDPNFFYAEYLVETGRPERSAPYLQKALNAPARPGRQLADDGRRDEARQLLEKIRSR